MSFGKVLRLINIYLFFCFDSAWSLFPNHSNEYSLSLSPRHCSFESKTTSESCLLQMPLTFYHTSRLLTTLKKKALSKHCKKGENVDHQHFLLFAQCFLNILNRISVFKLHLFCRLQMLSIRTSSKFCHVVKS